MISWTISASSTTSRALFLKPKKDVQLTNVQCTLESEKLSRFIETKNFRLNLESISHLFFNQHQTWKFNIQLTESNILAVWPVKLFLTDFINDWNREQPLDIYK